MLRGAHINDAEQMNKLVNHFAQKDLMLARPLSELYENIRDYYVYIENGSVVGCAALHIFWKDLAEIKSIAVEEDYQKRGIGKQLIQKCLEEGKVLGINRLFVLTYIPEFFERMGFKRVDKELLPHKIWSECVKCYKFPDCDEVPLIIEI
ncbi:MAG: N-acetyltransferase [Candidatus Scalindua sp.]|jgi:amino-acid N-acetyltransferase|nr:N-acetyltransferase [Candidatus Scalindua sp.]